VVVWVACGREAAAQVLVIVPGLNAPSVVPDPSLDIQVPLIPQLDASAQPNLAFLPENTFPDRVSECIQIGGASGLSSGNLAEYSMECANH
jgi:hypothetical protein